MPALSYKDHETDRKAGTQLPIPAALGKQWLLSGIVPEAQNTSGKQLAYHV